MRPLTVATVLAAALLGGCANYPYGYDPYPARPSYPAYATDPDIYYYSYSPGPGYYYRPGYGYYRAPTRYYDPPRRGDRPQHGRDHQHDHRPPPSQPAPPTRPDRPDRPDKPDRPAGIGGLINEAVREGNARPPPRAPTPAPARPRDDDRRPHVNAPREERRDNGRRGSWSRAITDR